MSVLLRDSAAAPDIFRWNGAIDERLLRQVISENGWVVPADLVTFWLKTGGGEIFETEYLLPPIASPGATNDVSAVTNWYRQRGLSHVLVFHQGLGMTAVSTTSGRYLYFDSPTEPLRLISEYVSLDDWYTGALRAEYADRYGLASL